MVEFTRLQLIINEDLIKSLLALWADLEASSVALISDITRVMDLLPDDSKFESFPEEVPENHLTEG